MLRLHLDENVDPIIADALRARGIDVTTTEGAGLLRQPDERHLEFAAREDRVIFTHDQDFLVMSSRGVSHPGIAFCHQHARTIGEIVQSLELLSHCVLPDEIRNQVTYL